MIEAVVQVGAQETRYLRCGRGSRTVVVLAGDAAEQLRTVARFAADHRVIVPVLPLPHAPEAAGFEDWLRGLLEGLGLEQPMIALSPGLASLAGRLVAGCGDVIELVIAEAPHAPR